MTKHTSPLYGALFCLAVAAACTWVDVDPGAEQVRIAQPDEVARCEKVGNVQAHTTDRVWMFGRSDAGVRQELLALGRNQAAQMGADTIVAGPLTEEGKQSFDAYRCRS